MTEHTSVQTQGQSLETGRQDGRENGNKRTKKLRCVTQVQKMRWKHMAQYCSSRVRAISQISHFRVFEVNREAVAYYKPSVTLWHLFLILWSLKQRSQLWPSAISIQYTLPKHASLKYTVTVFLSLLVSLPHVPLQNSVAFSCFSPSQTGVQ
jgi:hypothetical protein